MEHLEQIVWSLEETFERVSEAPGDYVDGHLEETEARLVAAYNAQGLQRIAAALELLSKAKSVGTQLCVQHEDCDQPAGHEKCPGCAKGIGGVCGACHCGQVEPDAEPETAPSQCQRNMRCRRQDGHWGSCQASDGEILEQCPHEATQRTSRGLWCQECGVKL